MRAMKATLIAGLVALLGAGAAPALAQGKSGGREIYPERNKVQQSRDLSRVKERGERGERGSSASKGARRTESEKARRKSRR